MVLFFVDIHFFNQKKTLIGELMGSSVLVCAVWRGSLKLTHAFTLQNSLMKRVFVHESKKAFIAKIQRDGEVEVALGLDPAVVAASSPRRLVRGAELRGGTRRRTARARCQHRRRRRRRT